MKNKPNELSEETGRKLVVAITLSPDTIKKFKEAIGKIENGLKTVLRNAYLKQISIKYFTICSYYIFDLKMPMNYFKYIFMRRKSEMEIKIIRDQIEELKIKMHAI